MHAVAHEKVQGREALEQQVSDETSQWFVTIARNNIQEQWTNATQPLFPLAKHDALQYLPLICEDGPGFFVHTLVTQGLRQMDD